MLTNSAQRAALPIGAAVVSIGIVLVAGPALLVIGALGLGASLGWLGKRSLEAHQAVAAKQEALRRQAEAVGRLVEEGEAELQRLEELSGIQGNAVQLRATYKAGRTRLDELAAHVKVLGDIQQAQAAERAAAAKRARIEKVLAVAQTRLQELQSLTGVQSEVAELNAAVRDREAELQRLEDHAALHASGHYINNYDYVTVDEYRLALEQTRAEREQMFKSGQAHTTPPTWSTGGRAVGDFCNLAVRAFNGECDAAIARVNAKTKNIVSREAAIRRLHKSLNDLLSTSRIAITPEYLDVRIKELHLTYEYAQVVESQRQAHKEQEAAERAERKAQEDAARAERKYAAEAKEYEKQLEWGRRELESNRATASEREQLVSRNEELERLLAEAQARMQKAHDWQKRRGIGHVFVLSSIGSLHKDICRIGVTRVYDPDERIRDLNVDLPFPYDVHALLYSEDAPKLAHELYVRFEDRRVNTVNLRREFFRVTMDDMDAALQDISKKRPDLLEKTSVQLTRVAPAEEYRQSVKNAPELPSADNMGN